MVLPYIWIAAGAFTGPSAAANDEEEIPAVSWRKFTDADRRPPLPPGDEEAHAVILYDSVFLDDGGFARKEPGFEPKTLNNTVAEKYASVRRYRALLVRDQAGVEAFGTVQFPHEDYSELLKVSARLTKPDGSVRFLEDRDFHKKTVMSSAGVQNERLVMVVPDLAPEDIVDYLYETRKEFDYAPPMVALQDDYPILEMSVVWKFREPLPPSPDFDASQYRYTPAYVILNRGPQEIWPVWSPSSQPVRLELTARNMRGFPAEDDAPPALLRLPVFVAWYKWPDWEAKGAFWDRVSTAGLEEREEFLTRTGDLDRWMRSVIARPRDEAKDVEDCLTLIHMRFHPAHERRTAPSEKGRINKNVQDVLQSGSGSSSDLNLLMLSMLRRLGYRASVFWCSAQRRGSLTEEWHSTKQFDYQAVLLQGTSGVRFLFPALRGSTSRTLPYQIAGGRALPMREPEAAGGPLFLEIPSLRARDNLIEVRGTLDLSSDSGRGTFEIGWDCPGEAFLLDRVSVEHEQDACSILRARGLPDWEEGAIRGERMELVGHRFSYACSLDATRLIEKAAGMFIADLAPFALERRLYDAETRLGPMDLHYPRTVRSVVDIVAPPGMHLESAGPIAHLAETFGQFDVGVTSAPGGARWRAEVILQSGWIEPGTYAVARRFFREYLNAVSQKIVFASTDAGE